ncbi:ATP-binding cassette sub-family A member 9 (ABC transporter) [Colletotrichum tofieldiae]|uniref:ATP-binding cassette sub-family A member 9 (ABC transporter) n=1 Tax=Colletotrichum tofieldiae TaxID=708197 RepID=A0A166UFC8_9PEZI|nr:ATP-binding cassette sub-family A member 9 (ABC transporter) [Colletotrichum tofieldiae]
MSRQSLGHQRLLCSIAFTDLPQTTSFDTIDRDHHWNYTIRADPVRRRVPYNMVKHNGDLKRLLLPLQVAVENAMTNSTINPVTFLFTSKTQDEWDKGFRSGWKELIANMYGFAFCLDFVQQIFHLTRLITQEREAGMSQVVDSMDNSATARASSAAIPIIWQILLGLSVNSSAVFAASFFQNVRTAPAYVSGAFMTLSAGALLAGLKKALMATVVSMSIFFPSSNHFFGQFILQPAKLGDIPPWAFWAQKKLVVNGNTLLSLFVVALDVYPLSAILVGDFKHGIAYKGRTFSGEGGSASPIAVEAKDLQKTFRPPLIERIRCFSRRKPSSAVNGVSLWGHRGQVLCLDGPNGSGKTTALQMMAGLLPNTSNPVNCILR